MELKQFVEQSITTESKIPNVTINPEFVGGVIMIMVAAGNILDQIKKNTYYGREFDRDGLKENFMTIVELLDAIKPGIIEEQEKNATDFDPRIFHSIVGIATEATELLEALTAEKFDRTNFLEELGDLNWYQAVGIDAVRGDFEQVLEMNVQKLTKSDKARYKNSEFSSKDAIDRDTKAEREVLENNS